MCKYLHGAADVLANMVINIKRVKIDFIDAIFGYKGVLFLSICHEIMKRKICLEQLIQHKKTKDWLNLFLYDSLILILENYFF